MEIIAVSTADELQMIRELFLEYGTSLRFHLCFDGFEREMAGLPGAYAPPRGRLLLARIQGQPAGCVALRPLESGVAELKRLYVRPEFRGQSIGRKLVQAILDQAREHYHRVRLDTLPTMTAARGLYESLGFHRIALSPQSELVEPIDMELYLDPRPGESR